jgi:hypothetical protein
VVEILISWDNYKGYDPGSKCRWSKYDLRGIDFGPVPIPRTYSISYQPNFKSLKNYNEKDIFQSIY